MLAQRIFSSDAGQLIDVTGLRRPTQPNFLPQMQMGMPQPFALPHAGMPFPPNPTGFYPVVSTSQAGFAKPPIPLPPQSQPQPPQQQQQPPQPWLTQPQVQQAPWQEGTFETPSIPLPTAPAPPTEQAAPVPPAASLTAAPPSLAAPVLAAPSPEDQGRAAKRARGNPPPATPSAPGSVKRGRGRPSNASKGLPTKRPPRKSKSKGNALVASSCPPPAAAAPPAAPPVPPAPPAAAAAPPTAPPAAPPAPLQEEKNTSPAAQEPAAEDDDAALEAAILAALAGVSEEGAKEGEGAGDIGNIDEDLFGIGSFLQTPAVGYRPEEDPDFVEFAGPLLYQARA